MKLLKSQYQDIMGLAHSFHISEQDLSLVKKKGRIKILVNGIPSSFEFFRRKSVSLSPGDHQWENLEHYELNFGDRKIIVASWTEVIQHLKIWLQQDTPPR